MLSWKHTQTLLDGAVITIQLMALSAAIGIAMSFIVGVARLARSVWIRAVARVYTELFRGVAAFILLYWTFYSLPTFGGPSLSPMTAGGLALGLNMGAYGSEIVRGAVLGVPAGQTEAGISLNLSNWQRLRHVILPQSLIAMLPPFGNLLIEVLKGTSLVGFITLSDLFFESRILRTNRVDSSMTIFLTVLVMYFVLAQIIAFGVRIAERYASRGLDLSRGGR